VSSVRWRDLAQPVAAGNALVEVSVARDEVLPPLIPVEPRVRPATLRDDAERAIVSRATAFYSRSCSSTVAAMKRNQARLPILNARWASS